MAAIKVVDKNNVLNIVFFIFTICNLYLLYRVFIKMYYVSTYQSFGLILLLETIDEVLDD